MNPNSRAILGAAACTLPVVVWAAGSVWLQTLVEVWQPEFLKRGVDTLWLAQALALAVLLPTYVGLRTPSVAAAGILIFVLSPLPVLCVAWLMGVLPIQSALSGVLSLAVIAMVLVLGVNRLFDYLPGPRLLPAATVLAQLAFVSVILVMGDRWLEWSEL